MTKEVLSAIQDAVGTQVFGIWFLIGAALVFFMQAGFAMVETGFTRAKNAGNIIMKNLMDFCIGTCVFIPLGFGILLGEDALGGFIGTPTLAGLVAITAPCDVVDAAGSIIIGVVAGLLVVFGVWFCDNVAHVDDPVGAVAVHCLNGIWGTIAVGLFATKTAPECTLKGLFYGGGFHQLGLQLLGVVSVMAWTIVTMTIVFKIIDKTVGLRVSEEEEIVGLDSKEHGLASAYAGFSLMDITEGSMSVNENTELGENDYDEASDVQRAASVKVTTPVDPSTGIHKVVIIAKLSRYEKLKTALNDLGVTGMTVTQVMGCGVQKGAGEKYRGVEMDVTVLPKVKVEVIVGSISVEKVIDTVKRTLYTGHVGDGKIFVYNVQKVVKVRTGEEDYEALKDVE